MTWFDDSAAKPVRQSGRDFHLNFLPGAEAGRGINPRHPGDCLGAQRPGRAGVLARHFAKSQTTRLKARKMASGTPALPGYRYRMRASPQPFVSPGTRSHFRRSGPRSSREPRLGASCPLARGPLGRCRRRPSGRRLWRRGPLLREAVFQSRHQIDDVLPDGSRRGPSSAGRRASPSTSRQHRTIAVLEERRVEIPGLCPNDMLGHLDHLIGQLESRGCRRNIPLRSRTSCA